MPRHNSDLVSEAEAAIADASAAEDATLTTSTTTPPISLPAASQHHTLKYHLLGPSLTKSGQDGVDQKRVSEIIYNASKGSRYFNNEEVKDRNLTAKITRILAKKRELERVEAEGGLKGEKRKADEYIAELEYERDLSQWVVHIDCDAFYAAVEELDRPELKDVPFAVGQGVLTTCNYVARKFGCRSGMAGFVADKLCPQLIHLPLNFDKYTTKAKEVRAVIEKYDPRFESASIDEAYLNITAYCQEHDMAPEDAVSQMREEVFQATRITISAGIAANAKLAKICSNKNKPNGQFLLPNDRASILAFMRDLPTRKVNGIGRVFERELDAIGVKTCGDIYEHRHYLYRLFGEKAFQFMISIYLGLGRTNVQPAEEYERKSVGTESTFHDMDDPTELRDKLRWTAEELEKDLQRTQFKGRTLVLKIKLHSYEVFTRQFQPPKAVYKKEDLYNFGLQMLEKLEKEMPGLKLRLMGLRCTHLVSMKKGEVDFFGRARQLQAASEAPSPTVEVDDDGWQKWPDEEFETAARLEKQEEIDELERLSQEVAHIDNDRQQHTHKSEEYRRYDNGFAWRLLLEQERAEAEEAALIHKPPIEQWQCPICRTPQQAEEKTFNAHIDSCLSRQAIKEMVQTEDADTPKPSIFVAASSSRATKTKRKRNDDDKTNDSWTQHPRKAFFA